MSMVQSERTSSLIELRDHWFNEANEADLRFLVID